MTHLKSLPTRIRANPALSAILLTSLILNLIGIRWGLPATESWIADSVAGITTLKVWPTYTISSHKYPYLHTWLAFLIYLPLLLWWLLTAQLDGGCWPYLKAKCMEAPFEQMGQLILISRSISALMGVGTVYVTYRLALSVGASRRAALGSALAVSLSYVAVFYAHLGNLDGPVTLWFTLSLLAYIAVLRNGRARDYMLFGLSSGLALGTKEGVIGGYVLVAIAIIAFHLRRNGPGIGRALRSLFDRRMLGLIGALLLVYIVATNPIFNWEGFVNHWKAWLPTEARMIRLQNRGQTQGAVTPRVLRHLAGGMDAPLFALCLAGLLPAARRARWSLALLLPAISYLIFSVFASRIVPMRVVLPLVPILAVYGGIAADHLLQTAGQRWRRPALALIALIYGHAGLHALNHDLLLGRDSRYAAEAWLRETVPQDAALLVFSDSRYLPRFEQFGYRAEHVEEEEDYASALKTTSPDYVVLSSRWFERFDGERSMFFDRLTSGELGYIPVFDHRSGLTIRSGMLGESSKASASVDPRIIILRAGGH